METWKECESKLNERLGRKRTEDWIEVFQKEIDTLESKTDATWSDLAMIDSHKSLVDDLMKQLAQSN